AEACLRVGTDVDPAPGSWLSVVEFESEPGEKLRDQLCGPVLAMRRLGMAVQQPAELDGLGCDLLHQPRQCVRARHPGRLVVWPEIGAEDSLVEERLEGAAGPSGVA